MTNWFKEQSSNKLEELQVIGPETYMMRKNIVVKEVEYVDDEGNTYSQTIYESDSRVISSSEYEMLKAIEENNSKIQGVRFDNLDDSQLTIMSAIADLYDVLA